MKFKKIAFITAITLLSANVVMAGEGKYGEKKHENTAMSDHKDSTDHKKADHEKDRTDKDRTDKERDGKLDNKDERRNYDKDAFDV